MFMYDSGFHEMMNDNDKDKADTLNAIAQSETRYKYIVLHTPYSIVTVDSIH